MKNPLVQVSHALQTLSPQEPGDFRLERITKSNRRVITGIKSTIKYSSTEYANGTNVFTFTFKHRK